MILISDAHINCDGEATDQFFSMLKKISATNHDVIFLGDIFELWIALPRYEQEVHLRFLDWCKSEKQNRSIGYIEGNHEFFLNENYAQCFTWCTTDLWHDSGSQILFSHGDMVNKYDISYRRFKKATKNSLTKFLAQYMPLAPQLVKYLKKKLTNQNKQRGYLPEDMLRDYADETFSESVSSIVLGHFHREFHYQNGINDLYSIPDWMETGKVSIYDNSIKMLKSHHWSEISEALSGGEK